MLEVPWVLGPPFSYRLSSRGSEESRALIIHRCGPGLNPGLDVMCELSFSLVRVLATRFLLRVFRFPPSIKKKKSLQIQNFHSIWKQCTTITSTDDGAGGGGEAGGRAVGPPLFPKNRDLIRVSSVPHFKSLISPLLRLQLGMCTN